MYVDIRIKCYLCISNYNYFYWQCRLIVSQMSNTRCESFHWMTPLFGVCIVISCWLPFFERFLLYTLFLVTTLCHWHYGYSVVNQMCVHFNRICFSVQMRTDVTKEGKQNGGGSSDAVVTKHSLSNTHFGTRSSDCPVDNVAKML